MIKLFLDTNVLADIFFDRMPHSNHSLTLLTLASDRSWQLSTSALTIANLLYLLRKQSKSKQQECIEIVTKYVQVLDLNLEQIKNLNRKQERGLDFRIYGGGLNACINARSKSNITPLFVGF